MAERFGEYVEGAVASGPAGSRDDRTGSAAGPPDMAAARDRLFRLAYRFLWEREDAEDVVQEALTRAYENRLTLRDENKWWSWMCSIVVNRCRVQGRLRKRHRKRDELFRQRERCISGAEDAGNFDRAHLKRQLQDALLRLPRRQREVVVLRHLEQMDYSRIADVLGLSPETVRVHARNGLERLQKLMCAQVGGQFERLANSKGR